MLQQDEADDFVVATSETHSVREFLELAFGHVGLRWQDHVVVDERFLRPADVAVLVGDAGQARRCSGSEPTIAFPELVAMMVESV